MHEIYEIMIARRKKEWFDKREDEPHGRTKYNAYPTVDFLFSNSRNGPQIFVTTELIGINTASFKNIYFFLPFAKQT